METTINIDLESLIEGHIFDVDELILIKSEDKMMTIRQSEPEEIQSWHYDIRVNKNSVEIKSTDYDNLTPENRAYEMYQQKLMGAGLWH